MKRHHIPVYIMKILDKCFDKIMSGVFTRTPNTFMNQNLKSQLLDRDQYTRHNILKGTVKGIDNEKLKQFPDY